MIQRRPELQTLHHDPVEVIRSFLRLLARLAPLRRS
jgi:hypothetical protein